MIYSIRYGGKSKPEVHVIELQTFINILYYVKRVTSSAFRKVLASEL